MAAAVASLASMMPSGIRPAPARPDPAKFRAAARHSRWVRLLRRAIPVSIAAVAALLIFEAYFNPFRVLANIRVDPSKIIISGTRIKMGSPRYAGYTSDNRPYEVTAQAASQDITKPDLIDLEDIWAKMEMQDKSTMVMTAKTGHYNSKIDRLVLSNEIRLNTSTGHAARLHDATIEIKKGSVVSENPVELEFLRGTLNANQLQIEDQGAMMRFGGGVTMTLTDLKQ
ncbi:MAG: LPS export ABC transporter periplasmic protein LptC [Xanthobacteraceae bacterium]|nr:LPS export ABC transporter periplasmic protein LptC [Xanthobacteraceae bacterium]MBV9237252.1 LPS export ABC transporter periplasmic protein LptC [Xanthobacteraceae bacterium]MBV9631018.1 LPS export ABC transporter periplasmic protein LptC [Xanthobacteraceae bacterium]